MEKAKYKIINGPNLNMLGQREIDLYGNWSLDKICRYTEEKIQQLPIELSWIQSNHEGALIDAVHALVESDYTGLVINPGAYSHTSLALYDALKILKIPIVEVHLTNVHQREKERQRLLTAKASTIIMGGLGKDAYFIAVYALYQHINSYKKGQV